MVQILNRIINLIFPPKCIFCESIVNLSSFISICEDCYKKIPFSHQEYTELSNEYPYTSFHIKLVCLCEYEGIIKQSLIRYKFMNKQSYNRTFGIMLAEKIKKMTSCRNFDIIVSVPLHKTKERLRGYNQAYLIAREVSRKMKVSENSQLLSRIRNTKSQSKLDKNDRVLNVKDAFKVKNEKWIKDKTILLIDDIATTGATMGECCKSLLEAGAKEVVCAVIASGRKY